MYYACALSAENTAAALSSMVSLKFTGCDWSQFNQAMDETYLSLYLQGRQRLIIKCILIVPTVRTKLVYV